MRRLLFGALWLALAAGACSDSSTTPTTPTPDPITDQYPGTLTVNGGNTYSFVTGISGSVTAQLSVLTPDTATVGLGLGVYNQSLGSCQVALSNDKATLNTVVQGYSDRAGNLCVRVYDVGLLTDPVDYQITVIHQ